MLSACDDPCVPSSGHLDRVVHGTTAQEVLSACDENMTVSTSEGGMANPAVHFFRGLRHRNLSAIRHAAKVRETTALGSRPSGREACQWRAGVGWSVCEVVRVMGTRPSGQLRSRWRGRTDSLVDGAGGRRLSLIVPFCCWMRLSLIASWGHPTATLPAVWTSAVLR